jgi:hypothetical protein
MDAQPFPSVADVGFLAYYPLLLGGLLTFPRPRLTRAERLRWEGGRRIPILGGVRVR